MRMLRNYIRSWLSKVLALAGLWVFLGLIINGVSLILRNEILSPILSSFGTALFVAFLSYILATNSGKESFREQSAKDARLRDKNNYYAPLSNELNTLITICKDAENGRMPYPQTFSLRPGDTEAEVPLFISPFPRPTFHGWGAFKCDAAIVLRFSPELQRNLDGVEKAVRDYNDAFTRYTQKVEQTLEQSITAARRDILEAREWKDVYSTWQTQQQEQRQKGLQSAHSPYDWFRFVVEPHSVGVAHEWVYSFQKTGYLPDTVGWLAQGALPKAAGVICHYYKDSLSTDAQQQFRQWIVSGVFRRVDGVYGLSTSEVRQALAEVIIKAERSRSDLLDKISIIQELYEGGSPM